MNGNRWLRRQNPEEHVLPVEAGQIVCPRRGIVDVESCFLCSRFRGFQEGITEGLVCRYESILGIPDLSWGMDAKSRTGRLRPVADLAPSASSVCDARPVAAGHSAGHSAGDRTGSGVRALP